jgi:hypothetical protein
VICVGAIDEAAQNLYNWGSKVDIWGPSPIRTTLTQDCLLTVEFDGTETLSGVLCDDNTVGEDEIALFGGTSASTPFVSGVLGLLKVADPSLSWSEAQQILWDTANPSTDPHVARGYVDAFRAVQAIRPNPPPLVTFLEPEDGEILPWSAVDFVGARVDDPPAPNGFDGDVIFHSDLDGEICRTSGNQPFQSCVPSFASLGTHLLTATATDAFGATGSDSIELTIFNQGPTVTITSPADGTTDSSDQLIPLRASVADVNETIPADMIVWESSLDGVLGTGANRSATLSSTGVHTLTVTATDAFGFSAADSVSVTIVAGSGQPSAVILAPADNTGVVPGGAVDLVGMATDPEDGNIDPSSVEWFSNLDGFLGSGTTLLDVILSAPECENFFHHVITLRVTDSDGNVDVDTIVIIVGRVC